MAQTPTSVKTLGTLIKVGVILNLIAFVCIVGLSYLFFMMNAAADLDSNDRLAVLAWGLLYFLLLLLSISSFWITVILVLVWVYTCYKNTIVFDRYAVATTPGWAVAHWFIPIGNLFLPYRTIKEIYLGSEPLQSDELLRPVESVPLRIPIWWCLWVFNFIVFLIANNLDEESAPGMAEYSIVYLVFFTGLWVSCGAIFYTIIDELSRRQERLVLRWRSSEIPAPSYYSASSNTLGNPLEAPLESNQSDIIETDEDYRGSGQ